MSEDSSSRSTLAVFTSPLGVLTQGYLGSGMQQTGPRIAFHEDQMGVPRFRLAPHIIVEEIERRLRPERTGCPNWRA